MLTGVEDSRLEAPVARRAEEHLKAHLGGICRSTDRVFAWLILAEWLGAILTALVLSPESWTGTRSHTHIRVWSAFLLGGGIASLPVCMAFFKPGLAFTRHVIAIGQMLMGALLIHLTGGRIETHFHVFGSLALMAFYRDWRVIVTATMVVALDRIVRGIYYPQTVFGVISPGAWRWLEHTAWVVFADTFIVTSGILSLREVRAWSARQGQLEATRARIEQTVQEQTQALRISETKYRRIVETANEGIWVIDAHGRTEYANQRMAAMLGYSVEEMLHRPVEAFLKAPPHPGSNRDPCPTFQIGEQLEVPLKRKDGSKLLTSISSSCIQDLDGTIVGTIAMATDMTDRKRDQDRLEYQAFHDALTGLPNRALFQEHLVQCIASSRRHLHSFALLLIDLDRFKEINDTLGHIYGDLVLQQVGMRFRHVLRESDILARLGGDEFSILLPGIDRAGASPVIDRLLASLKEPFVLDGQSFELGASLGATFFPEHGTDAATLLRLADVAMYSAKRADAGYRVYSSEQNEYSPRRLALIGELRLGIETNQLVLHYQPKLDLKAMRAQSAEALVRWLHPRDGLMSPAQFVPLAEHTGLIRSLSLWVLNTALLQCRMWRRNGLNINVAVNLPTSSLQQPELVATITRLIETAGAQPTWLTVEITESAMITEPKQASDVLSRLHEMGIRVSVDDFGTGHSSLSYLKNFPIDEVKIDRSFIRELTASRGAATIVNSVIDLAHAMNLHVVAEGVEDRATLEALRLQGCDSAQGFLVSHPLPAAEFTDWIRHANAGLVLDGAEARTPAHVPDETSCNAT